MRNDGHRAEIMNEEEGLIMERRVYPVRIYGDTDSPPGKESPLVVCLGETTIGSTHSLRVDFHEKGGERNFGFGTYGRE